MLLNRQQISERIPHQGKMCLLDAIQSMDLNNISAQTIITADNPMLESGLLGSWSLIEIAAQAAAVHFSSQPLNTGADFDSHEPTREGGYLVQVKAAEIADKAVIAGDALSINAQCLSRQDAAAIYSLQILRGQQLLITARITFAIHH